VRSNPKEAEQISWAMAANLLSLDTRVAEALVAAIKQCEPDLFAMFWPSMIKQIDFPIKRSSKEPNCICQDIIKNTATLIGKLALFLPKGEELSPPPCSMRIGTKVSRRKHPPIIGPGKNFPEQVLQDNRQTLPLRKEKI
jgi:hypothetical protein